MNAIGTASGLAISVGIIGVAVYSGAAGADYRAASGTDGCTPSSSTSAPSSSVTTTTEPTTTTTTTTETSTSAPETSTPTSTPDSCSTPPATGGASSTTTVVQPRGTTQPPSETESGGGSVDKTLEPESTPTTQTLASGGGDGSGGGIGGSAAGQGPHADQVPRPGQVPDGPLPHQNVPVVGTHVPDFGLLGPDPKSLTAASMSSGDAEALPVPQPALGNAELLAVSALAMVVGLLARTLAVRPIRVVGARRRS